MNREIIWLVVAFVASMLFPISATHAGFLDDLIGHNSGNTKIYNHKATNLAQTHRAPAVRHDGQTYKSRLIPPQQPASGRQLITPQVTYQQPLAQNRPNTKQVPPAQTVSKKKPVKNMRANTNHRSVKTEDPVQRHQVVRSYMPPAYPGQPPSAFPQTYNQASAAGYYATPYQSRYHSTPSYYQGYSHNSWGFSPQACAPGSA